MNADLQTVVAAADAKRGDLFLGTAARLGTAVQNVEKDFRICWAVDALFNDLPPGGPRLLFTGGTSPSKAFGLISRFSEHIDITVFRDDLGQSFEGADLEGLSRACLDAFRDACLSYIVGPLTTQCTAVAAVANPGGHFSLEADPGDKEGRTLLLWYPAITATEGDYIRAAVKIEAGAKSALDPHIAATVTPYVAADLPSLDLTVHNVTTVQPERTFWDKVIILHGLRQWYGRRKELRYDGQRVSQQQSTPSQRMGCPHGRLFQ